MGQTVDHTALRVTQTTSVLALTAALLLDAPWLVALLCLALALEAIVPALAPVRALYVYMPRPDGLLAPDLRPDDPAGHQVTQGLNAVLLALAVAAFLAGLVTPGWTLAGLVALLAALELLAEVRTGCYIHEALRRRGPRG